MRLCQYFLHHNRTIHLRVAQPATIICGQVTHLNSQNQVFLVPPICDTSIFQPSQNQIFLVPPICDTGIFQRSSMIRNNFNGHLFVPRLFTQNLGMRSKFCSDYITQTQCFHWVNHESEMSKNSVRTDIITNFWGRQINWAQCPAQYIGWPISNDN